MKKFIFLVIAIIIVGIAVVAIPDLKKDKQIDVKSGEENEDRPTTDSLDNSDRLAFWFPHHDSLNSGLVSLAEVVWRLDSAAANGNNKERDEWFAKCEKDLVRGFDSIHSGSTLSNYRKADSMLTEIEDFFKKDADLSTMGMIVNFDLQSSFLTYRISAESKQIMTYDPTIDDSKNWDILQKAMTDFCVGVVLADWFGGSGAGPASIASRNSILEARYVDLKRIHKMCLGEYPARITGTKEFGDHIDNRLTESIVKFKKAVEQTSKSIGNPKEVKDWLPEDRLNDYTNLYDKIQASKKPLIEALGKWLDSRDKTPKCAINAERAAKNKYKEITAEMVDSLTICVVDCHAEG